MNKELKAAIERAEKAQKKAEKLTAETAKLEGEEKEAKIAEAKAADGEFDAAMEEVERLQRAAEAKKKIAEARKAIEKTDIEGKSIPAGDDVQVGEEPLERAEVQKKAVMKALCRGLGALTEEERKLLTPQSAEEKVLTSAAGSAGVLVPPEYRTELLRYLDEEAVIRPLATVIPTTTNTIYWPRLAQGSDKLGGVAVVWTEEGEDKSEVQPKFEQKELTVHEVSAYTVVTNHLLDDSNPAIGKIIEDLFGDAVIDAEETVFVSGNGVIQPMGIVNEAGIQIVARITAGTVTYDDLVNLTMAIPRRHRKRGVFIIDDTVESTLKKLKDSQGRPLYYRSYRDDGDADRLIGYPVIGTGRTPAIGSPGDIIFADLKNYVIADRSGIAIGTSPHVYYIKNRTVIRVVKRVGGQPLVPQVFAILQGES